MTTEQRVLQIEAELAALKADLVKDAPTMERQDDDHTNDALRYLKGKKEWEILEFRHMLTGKIDYIDGRQSCINYDWYLKDNNDWIIWRVRRLSDKTVWNVGQFVKPESPASKGWDRHPVHVIKSFHIGDSGQMYACCDSNFPVCGPIHSKTDAYKSGSFLLSELKPSSKTTPTPTNGVEIVQRETVYTIVNGIPFEWVADATNPPGNSETLAAEKAYNAWLAEQPILSLNDISRFIDIGPYCELETLVKDKISKR